MPECCSRMTMQVDGKDPRYHNKKLRYREEHSTSVLLGVLRIFICLDKTPECDRQMDWRKDRQNWSVYHSGLHCEQCGRTVKTVKKIILLHSTVTLAMCCTTNIINLGFISDEHLTISDQISALSKSCYCHIRELRCLRPYLDFKTASTFATPIVYSKLEHCNSLYYNLPVSDIRTPEHPELSCSCCHQNAKICSPHSCSTLAQNRRTCDL